MTTLTLATLLVRLKADNKEYKKGVDDAKKENRAFSSDVKANIANASKAAFAVAAAAAIKFAADSVAAASDAQESYSKFSVVFGEVAADTEQQLDAMGDAIGRSAHELIGYAGNLGDILQPMGFNQQAAADLSTQLVQLGADLSSFNNMTMDEALQRLQGTLIGSHENALAFGVVINENTLKAELAKQGWDKLTGAQLEQAKVQARINLLMAGTTAAQGDAVRTADGYANKTRALESSFYDLQVVIGEKLIPTMTAVVDKTIDLVDNMTTIVTTSEQVQEALNNLAEKEDDSLEGTMAQAKAIADTVDSLGYWESALADVTGQMDPMKDRMRELAIGIIENSDSYEEAVKNLESVFGDLLDTSADLDDDFDTLTLQSARLGTVFIGVEGDMRTLVGAGKVYDSWMVNNTLLTRNSTNATDELTGAISEQAAEYLNALPVSGNYADSLYDISDASVRESIAVNEAARQVRNKIAENEAARLAEEELAKATEEAAEAVRQQKEAYEALTSSAFASSLNDQVEAALSGKQATVDWKEELFQQASALGLNGQQLALLAAATGNYTDAQIAAALKAAAMSAKVKELAESIANGEITVGNAITALQNFETELDESTTAVEGTDGAALSAAEQVDILAQKLTDMDGITTHATVDLTTIGIEQMEHARGLIDSFNAMSTPSYGGNPGNASGAYTPPAQAYADGGYTGHGSGIAGLVHQGEYVFSAPAVQAIGLDALESMHEYGRGAGGGMPSGMQFTFNIRGDVSDRAGLMRDIKTAVNQAMQQSGRQANTLRRMR